jgi:ubiquinone/menaquinone biosynthesis C-methylase UbiE
VQGTASNLPFSDERFGRVVSSLTFHEVRDRADKTVSLVEALRVLDQGGRFAVVDLFDDPAFYGSRGRVLEAVRASGAEVESARRLCDLVDLGWPMDAGKVLGHAVVVVGTKNP